MGNVLAIIMAGGSGSRLSVLSDKRAKPALPFGGKFRIIDFALSNCVNSDIEDVVVLSQYNPRSLNDHIGTGRPWDLDRVRHGGMQILQPYISREGLGGAWYRGTADAVLQNMNVIAGSKADAFLILAGDHIYEMDYRPFLVQHAKHHADVTIAVRHVPREEATRMGVLALDEHGRVTDWQEKPREPKSDLASMGVYVFSREALLRWLDDEHPDFGHDVIPAMLAGHAKIYGYLFDGYWRDVGTIASYWEANLDLAGLVPPLDMFDPDWRIHTRSEERSPAKIGPDALVRQSLISHGCIINGAVINSVLSPGVRVEEGALVIDSIIMLDSTILHGARVDHAIINKLVAVGEGAVVGEGDDFRLPNVDEPTYLTSGITVIGKHAVVPPGTHLGRNVRVDPDAVAADYPGTWVPSGTSVVHLHQRRTNPRPATAPSMAENNGEP